MSMAPPLAPEKALVCEEPPLVCEALPVVKNPTPKPKASPVPVDKAPAPTSVGRSTPNYDFLDHEQLMCVNPDSSSLESGQLNLASSKPYLDPALFTATLENSKLIAQLDLQLQDTDGVQQRSQQDIQGIIHQGNIAINRELFVPALEALKGQQQNTGNTSTLIKDVRFDAKSQSYIMDLEVTKRILKIPVWDNFEVRFQARNGELNVEIDDNWFPDKKIVEQLEKSIRNTLRQKIPQQEQVLSLETETKGKRLILRPQLKNIDIPLGQQGNIHLENIESKQARVHFDQQGHLHLGLNNIAVKGSSSLKPAANATPTAAQTPDQTELNVQLALGKDGNRQMLSHGQLDIHLNPEETAQVKLGNDRLGDFLGSGDLKADFALYFKQMPGEAPLIKSSSRVQIENADIGQGSLTNLETALELDFSSSNGVQLRTASPQAQPLALKPTAAGVKLYINGSEYFPEMKRLISSAKESLALETFMFTDDTSGREIANLLASKAAGMDPSASGLAVDPQTPAGVDVRFIFNSWKGNTADGKASAKMLSEARETLKTQIQKSNLPAPEKTQRIANLERNLNWTFFSEGLLRSDHRKVLVVDGSQATVGGMNMGENYLSDHSYHDLMIKMAGPEVRDVHREFLENWYAFRQETPPANWQSQIKAESELQIDLENRQATGEYSQKAAVQTLVTDDHQIEIEQGLIDIIDSAQQEINIEQAFFADETINAHLSQAIERGVNVNIIVAQRPLAESVFTPANLLSAYQLAKAELAGAPGQVSLSYYEHEQGGKQGQIHAKAISADGKRAIVGSANMIGRSLSSPFIQRDADGQTGQALYNKELSLLLEDANFVEELNQRLFDYDRVHQSTPLDAKAIQAAVEAAGGEAELRKKALAAPFT